MSTRRQLTPVFVALVFAVAPLTWAGSGGNSIPFDEANVFLELNNTDGDLGLHALIDGDAWEKLEICGSSKSEALKVKVKGKLAKQGLTELFFESAEPPFDELPPDQFLQRFPAGTYRIEGTTIEGDKLKSTDELTHLLPAPPGNVRLSGTPAVANCDVVPLPMIAEPVVITWDAVTTSHPTIGTTSASIDLVAYQVVIERAEPTPLVVNVELAPTPAPQFQIPSELIAPGQQIKFEILAREASGNQTAIESCFLVM